MVKNQELSLESGVELASSLGLITARRLCVLGHVIGASLPAMRHSSLIRHRNALTVKASVDALQGLSNCAATYVNEKTFESSDEML